jgi:DNA-binding transcriptional regulator YiaG
MILRLARREIRDVTRPMRTELRGLRRKLGGLPKAVGDLGRHVADLLRSQDLRRARLQASPAEVEAARFSGGLIQKLRRRLKLTQAQLAQLVDVSVTAVRAWELGQSRPQGARRAALVALRKMGRREVARMVASRTAQREAPARRKGRARRVRRPARRRKRR